MAYRKAGVGNELCPPYADALREYEPETDNLSSLSKDIEKRNFDLLLQPDLKQEAITNLIGALTTKEFLANRYPLGKFGAVQVVDHAISMMQ